MSCNHLGVGQWDGRNQPAVFITRYYYRRPPHGGVPVDVPYGIIGSDRIFETSKSGEFSGFELSVILFLWENEKKSGAQRPISIFFETWA